MLKDDAVDAVDGELYILKDNDVVCTYKKLLLRTFS